MVQGVNLNIYKMDNRTEGLGDIQKKIKVEKNINTLDLSSG